jgi:hypothetical protein
VAYMGVKTNAHKALVETSEGKRDHLEDLGYVGGS